MSAFPVDPLVSSILILALTPSGTLIESAFSACVSAFATITLSPPDVVTLPVATLSFAPGFCIIAVSSFRSDIMVLPALNAAAK